MQTLSDRHSTGRTLYHEWDSICTSLDCTGHMLLIYYISWARLYCKHHFFIHSILYKPELQTCRLCLIDTPMGAPCTTSETPSAPHRIVLDKCFRFHVISWACPFLKPHFFIHNILYKPELQTCTLCLIDTPPGVPCTTSETLSAPHRIVLDICCLLITFLGYVFIGSPVSLFIAFCTNLYNRHADFVW